MAWLVAPQSPAEAATWHSHEMLFGFAAAIVSGILLTALPSWAGTPEWQGGRLAALVALWVAGRIAFWCEALPLPWRGAIDFVYFPVMMLWLAPQLLRLSDRRFLWLLPILGGFAAAQALYWLGHWRAEPTLRASGLHWGVHALLLLFVVKGGLLTPIFTGNALRERRLGDAPKFLPELEYGIAIAVLLLALTQALATPAASLATICFGSAALLVFRSWRWQAWRVADLPMLAAMHLAFLWLIVALVLRGWAALDVRLPRDAWLHAFLVGAVGAMMLSLMNRVSLRHSGRAMMVTKPMRWAFVAINLAALVRVAAALGRLDGLWTAGAMTLWAAAFGTYLVCFARVLCSPSQARAATPEEAARLKRETPD